MCSEGGGFITNVQLFVQNIQSKRLCYIVLWQKLKTDKKFKKTIDNRGTRWYNSQAVREERQTTSRKSLEKFFKKLLKKVLTRGKRCGIIVKLSPARETEDKRSLKIEQQERSTKHSIVRNTNLVKRVYIYSNKVREAKIKIARKQIITERSDMI